MLAVILGIACVIAGLDQLFKYLVVSNLQPGDEVSVIDNLFSIRYVKNTGVAFGLFEDNTILFSIVTALLIGIFIYLIVTKKLRGKLFAASAILMIGGGIGNLIDRLFRHFVVDYLAVSFFPPVCNFADYCITIGAALFIIVMLRISFKEKSALKAKAAADADITYTKSDADTDTKADTETDTKAASDTETTVTKAPSGTEITVTKIASNSDKSVDDETSKTNDTEKKNEDSGKTDGE